VRRRAGVHDESLAATSSGVIGRRARRGEVPALITSRSKIAMV
jgi:hypothetical protein